MTTPAYFAHETAVIDDGAQIGEGSKIWHFTHVMGGARIGRDCVLGQNVYIADVTIGDGVRIQNNVSVYEGVTLEDQVFCGPSCVFTNVTNPRAEITKDRSHYGKTLVGRGATIGANATILCGVTIGPYAMIGAGAVVSHDVPAHALVVGVPAEVIGWKCRCGSRLDDGRRISTCARCDREYEIAGSKCKPVEP
jgi:UDP-2-acetamido-3-amino-2,3-dideoxy-glucuronate N-acetyltransferase